MKAYLVAGPDQATDCLRMNSALDTEASIRWEKKKSSGP